MLISDSVIIKKTDNISVEYVENELKKLNIVPLRWAIVDAEKDLKISVTYERIQYGRNNDEM